MKEAIEKVVDFYKENAGTRWLIKDIIVSVLSLTIPTAATVVGLILHLTWLIIVGAVLYFVFTLCLIANIMYCVYYLILAVEALNESEENDDEEDEEAAKDKTVFHAGDRVRAIHDIIFYRRGMEGFVEEIDDTITSYPSIKVSFIDPIFGRLAGEWVNGEDFELSNHKEDA